MKLDVPFILVFLAAAVLQVSLGDLISIYGIKPSLTLITVYALSVTASEGKGLMYGAAGGFIEDCLSGGLVGLFLSGYAIVGYLAGKAGKRLFNVGESANFTGIFVLSLIQGVYTALVMSAFIGGYGVFGAVARFALPQALYNAAVGAFMLWVFKGQVERRTPWLKVIRQLRVRF
jgi:rod shape-determining protein MreD